MPGDRFGVVLWCFGPLGLLKSKIEIDERMKQYKKQRKMQFPMCFNAEQLNISHKDPTVEHQSQGPYYLLCFLSF